MIFFFPRWDTLIPWRVNIYDKLPTYDGIIIHLQVIQSVTHAVIPEMLEVTNIFFEKITTWNSPS